MTAAVSAYPCSECPLHETAITVCVAPTTAFDPSYAIIGDHKDKIPPVIWRELSRLGLYKADAFVSGVIKCDIPERRAPKASELRRCSPYLKAELDWLRHETRCGHVLAIGAAPFKALGGTGPVRNATGVRYTYKGLTIHPVPHPTQFARSPSLRQKFYEALETFVDAVKGHAPSLPRVKVHKVLDETGMYRMIQALVGEPAIAYDVETYGLDEQHERADILCVAYCARPREAWVVMLGHPSRTGNRSSMEDTLRKFHTLQKEWIAHNGKFDNKWLRRFGLGAPQLTKDTIIMAHLLNENDPKTVESVAAKYLQIPSWGEEMQPFFHSVGSALLDGTDLPRIDEDVLSEYAGLDVSIERRLADALWDKMNPQLQTLHNTLVEVSETLEIAEEEGVYIDPQQLSKVFDLCEREMEKAVEVAAEVTGLSQEDVKLGSSKWLVETLFERLELPIVAFTGGGAPTTNESALKRLREYHPRMVQAILDYRKYQKWMGSYLVPWGARRNELGRLRSSYNITGTVTGRLSCTNVKVTPQERPGMSLHQVPRDEAIRKVVAAPKDRRLIVADYSQIELRVAASLAKEPRMLRAYLQGEDIHTLTAATVTGKKIEDVTRDDRERAKAVNFGFLYGMGARTFVDYARDDYDIEFSLDEAQEIRAGFFALYSGLLRWHREQEATVRQLGYVVSPFGRVRNLPDVYSKDQKVSSEAVRQAINSPVQATASDLTLIAMRLIHERYKFSRAVKVVGQVHDSILVECHADMADVVATDVKAAMEEEAPARVKSRFGYVFPVPFTAEVAIGTSWGEYEKVLA